MSDLMLILEVCGRLGVQFRLDGPGQLKVLGPQEEVQAVLPDVRRHKDKICRLIEERFNAKGVGAGEVWQRALDLLDGDPEFPKDLLPALRAATVEWSTELPDAKGAP